MLFNRVLDLQVWRSASVESRSGGNGSFFYLLPDHLEKTYFRKNLFAGFSLPPFCLSCVPVRAHGGMWCPKNPLLGSEYVLRADE